MKGTKFSMIHNSLHASAEYVWYFWFHHQNCTHFIRRLCACVHFSKICSFPCRNCSHQQMLIWCLKTHTKKKITTVSRMDLIDSHSFGTKPFTRTHSCMRRCWHCCWIWRRKNEERMYTNCTASSFLRTYSTVHIAIYSIRIQIFKLNQCLCIRFYYVVFESIVSIRTEREKAAPLHLENVENKYTANSTNTYIWNRDHIISVQYTKIVHAQAHIPPEKYSETRNWKNVAHDVRVRVRACVWDRAQRATIATIHFGKTMHSL